MIEQSKIDVIAHGLSTSAPSAIIKFAPALTSRLITHCLVLLLLFSPRLHAESAESQLEIIKIGGLLWLTSEFAPQANAFREGAELAAADWNVKHSLDNRQVRFVVEDVHGGNSSNTGAKKLLYLDKVSAALLQSYQDVMVASSYFEKEKVPAIALWDASPEIDAIGKFIFAIGPWAPSSGTVPALFSLQKLKSTTAVIICHEDHWSQMASDYFQKEFEHGGGKILKRFDLNPDVTDFRSVLAQVKQAAPAVVYVPIVYNIVPFYTQLRELEIGTHIVSSDIISTENINSNSTAFEGVYQANLQDPTSAVYLQMAQAYSRKFGKEVTFPWFVGAGFDAMNLLLSAIDKVGADSVKIAEELYKIKNFPGATAHISISETGSAPQMQQMFEIKGGKFVPVI